MARSKSDRLFDNIVCDWMAVIDIESERFVLRLYTLVLGVIVFWVRVPSTRSWNSNQLAVVRFIIPGAHCRTSRFCGTGIVIKFRRTVRNIRTRLYTCAIQLRAYKARLKSHWDGTTTMYKLLRRTREETVQRIVHNITPCNNNLHHDKLVREFLWEALIGREKMPIDTFRLR